MCILTGYYAGGTKIVVLYVSCSGCEEANNFKNIYILHAPLILKKTFSK